MNLPAPTRPPRSEGFVLSLEDGEIRLAPITLGAARAALELGADARETDPPRVVVDRLVRQVHRLCGTPGAALTARLALPEVAAVVGQLFYASAGESPERCALAGGTAGFGDGLTLLQRYVARPLEFAALMHRLPAAANVLPLGEAIALHGCLDRQARAGIGFS